MKRNRCLNVVWKYICVLTCSYMTASAQHSTRLQRHRRNNKLLSWGCVSRIPIGCRGHCGQIPSIAIGCPLSKILLAKLKRVTWLQSTKAALRITRSHWCSLILTLCKYNKSILVSDWLHMSCSALSTVLIGRIDSEASWLRSPLAGRMYGNGASFQRESLRSVCACRREENIRHFVPNVIIFAFWTRSPWDFAVSPVTSFVCFSSQTE